MEALVELRINKIFSFFKKNIIDLPQMEFSRLGPYINCTIGYKKDISDIPILREVSCGVNANPKLATLIALVEFLEREVIKENIENRNLFPFQDSTGCASYPKIYSIFYRKVARENALAEALERFVWTTWWKNREIGHRIANRHDFLLKNNIAINGIKIETLIQVTPLIDNSKKLQVVILYGKLNSGGYVSGAAAGSTLDFTFQRAYSELLRHFVALVNLDKIETSKNSYINRLVFMGAEENSKLLSSRINEIGSKQISIPKLTIDCEIGSKKFNKIIYTHKCRFENQPVFIDSDPTIFCI